MKKRDREILLSLEKFKVLSRDQIATLHFSNNANPNVSANRVLKRLRDANYIIADTNKSFKPYNYFLNPSLIKIDSQKIDHHLMIAQGYIDMMKYSPVGYYDIESKIEGTDIIPDAQSEWLDNKWFLEFQNSVYTVHQLYKKLNKYAEAFNKGYWESERILIIGKMNLKFDPDDYPFKIKQINSIHDLKETIEIFKEKRFQEFKGKVKEEFKTSVSSSQPIIKTDYKSRDGKVEIVL